MMASRLSRAAAAASSTSSASASSSSSLLASAAAAVATTPPQDAGSKIPSPFRMIYDVLTSAGPDERLTTDDIWNRIHERYPSPVHSQDSEPGMLGGKLPKGFKLRPSRNDRVRPFPDHPIGSRSQLKSGFLRQLKEARMLRMGYEQPTSNSEASLGGREIKAHGKHYWKFDKRFGTPVDEHGSPTELWQRAFGSQRQNLPGPLGIAAKINHWTAQPLPTSANYLSTLPFVPGKFGVPAPTIRRGKPALTEREQIVLNLKKFSVRISRQRLRILPDKIIAFRKWEERIEDIWAKQGVEGVQEQLAIERAATIARKQRRSERFGLIEPTTFVQSHVDDGQGGLLPMDKADSPARANIRRAYAELYALEDSIAQVELDETLSAAVRASLVAEKTEAKDTVQSDIDALLVDLPAAEAAEERQRTIAQESEYRTKRAIEKAQLDSAARRAAIAEEQRIELLQIEQERAAAKTVEDSPAP